MSVFDRPAEPNLSAEQVIARGHHAARLLEDEVLRAAHDDAERSILFTWLHADDAETREIAWAKIHALDEIRRALKRMVAEGEHAARKRNSR